MKRNTLILTCVLIGSLWIQTSFADVITGATFQQWGEEIITRIEDEMSRYDGLYAKSTSDGGADYAWGQGVMSHALVAAAKIDPSYLPRARKQADEFHLRYWCSLNGTSGYNAGYGGCGDRYYDDNAWIALALIELYQLSDCPKYLDWAQETVVFCMTGENGPGDSPDGGIRWHESNTGGTSVCSTAPTILSNLLLYRITSIESYKTDALRLYNWIMDTDNGLRYSTGIFHEYNQGALGYQTAVMTQAATQLYLITGDTAHLTEAHRMAAAMVSQFINNSTHALGQHGKWGGHDMTNAYVELFEVDGDPYWLDVATGYLEFLHNICKDDATGFYPAVWNDTSGAYATGLIDNASVARAYWKMASAPGGQTPDNSYCQVTNRTAGRCLRPYNSVTNDNTNVIIYDKFSTYTSERWKLKNLRNGYFNIESVLAADKSLQLYNNQVIDNTNMVIYTTNLAAVSQQWALVDLENGYFNIQNKLAGKSLRPLNGSTGNNTNVVIVPTDLSDQSQQWRIDNITPPRSLMPYVSVNSGNWWQTNEIIVDAGDTVSLKAEGPDSGTWRWEGHDGFTATGKEITLTNMQPYQAGYYTVIHTSTGGVESFTAFHIKVPAVLTMYQHIDYNQNSIGWVAQYGAGAYTTADIVAAGGLNNDMTSFKIEPGYTVTFYDGDNFTGGTLVKTTSATYIGSTWNDRISSMIIEGDPSPVGYWQFNDPGDTVADDASGNGFDGTLMNMDAGSWTAGKQCGGLDFDGVDDYILIEDICSVSPGSNITVSLWMKAGTKEAQQFLCSFNTATGGNRILLGRNASDINLGIYDNAQWQKSNTPVFDGAWHHVAFVLSPSLGLCRLYVDGSSVYSYATTTSVDAGDILTLGQEFDGLTASDFYEGLMDEVRIYNRALSAAEILETYQQHALVADFEGDHDVDMNDFVIFASEWQNPNACDIDLTCDCIVDMDDLLILISEWLREI